MTHPDADHIQGILKLFEKFPPNQDLQPGKAKFEFNGPLLLTKLFFKEHYTSIIRAIERAKFRRQERFYSGEEISGFDRWCRFFYPLDEFPGVLYMYQPSSPASPEMLPASRYSVDDSEPNKSSTLLVIDGSSYPLISLNGDALGYSILKSLENSHPKIFKVPHHGSVHNSIALEKYEPRNKKLIKKLLATLAFLQIENGSHLLVDKHIMESQRTEFFKKFELPPETTSKRKEICKKKRRLKPLFFNDELNYLAHNFIVGLRRHEETQNTTALLHLLTSIYNTIERNLTNNVRSDDVYTHEVQDMTSFEGIYNSIHNNLCPASANYLTNEGNKVRARKLLFSFLETDKVFEQEITFIVNKEFYSRINARTYFISSGELHGHPGWEVINGIIVAAHEYHRAHSDYNCRLLLTSGNNIKGDKLRRLRRLRPDWTQFVSLQYFAPHTASVKISANHNDELAILPGTMRWEDTPTDAYLSELLDGYNETRGAKALKEARAADSGRYEIVCHENYWLYVHPGTPPNLQLSSVRMAVAVQSISITFDASVQNIVTEFAFYQLADSSPASISVFGLLGYHTPTSGIKTYLLYIVTDEHKQYLKVTSDGELRYSNERKDATHFRFTAVPAEPTTIGKHFMAVCKSIPLEEFLKLTHYTKNIILCKELLNIVMCKQFISQLLSEHSNLAIGRILELALGWRVDRSSTFLVEDSDVLAADIKVVLPSEQLKLHNCTITGVSFAVSNPKMVSRKVSLQLEASDDEIPVTFSYHLKSTTFASSFQKYLMSLRITKNLSSFKMFDALIFLHQSGIVAYDYLSSLVYKMLFVLRWKIDEKASELEFVEFPTGPIVISADIIAKIPDKNPPIDLGMKDPLKLTKIGFTLPSQLDSTENTYLFAHASVADIKLQMKAVRADENAPPTLQVSLAQPISLSKIIHLLQISFGISKFAIPLTSKLLEDINITEADFTYQQGIQSSEQIYLYSVAFQIVFNNLGDYLPASFSGIKSIDAQVKIYQPTLPNVQIGLEIGFEFSAMLPRDKSIALDALFTTEPVLANHGTYSSHNFTVSVNSQSDVVGTTKGGVTLADFCQIFGLTDALSTVQSIPIFKSILENVELNQLILAMNTSSKEVKTFVLDLRIFNWTIIPEKVIVNEADIIMSYIDHEWTSKFDASVLFNSVFFVDAHFELYGGSHPSKFNFTNLNNDFTVAKFLEVFGLGNMDNVPVVGQFLSITVTEAFIQISKETDGTMKITEGRISLYSESINIGSLFQLFQVKCSIGFILDPEENSYVFGFAVSGFINDKIHLDIKYDCGTSVLAGQIFISSFTEVNFIDLLSTLNKDGTDAIKKNGVFDNISQSFTFGIEVCISKNFRLTDLVIDLKKVLPLGPVLLQRLHFEYHSNTEKDSQSQDLYKLAGELVSEMHSIGALLEFDLTTDTTEQSTVKASLMPTQGSSLTLNSFLSVLNIASPRIPEIEGKKLPPFFDIALTKGTVTLSISSFDIVAFEVDVSTVDEVVILGSPLIKLSKLSLQVKYDVNATPTTKAFLTGKFSIGNVQLTLKGSKKGKGTFFSVVTDQNQISVGIQESFNQLTPNSESSVIPSNIGIPKNFNVFVARLDVELLYACSKRLLKFATASNFTWHVDVGFQQFIVNHLGGILSYQKSTAQDSSEFCVYLVGQF